MIPFAWRALPLVLASCAAATPVAAAALSDCRAEDGFRAAFDGRRTFLLQPAAMAATKARLQSDPATAAAYAELIRAADAALARKPGSVMDKTTIPLSNDRHDYLSLAPYWWPDPANPKGPHVRRDGEVNPRRDTRAFDRTAIGRMGADARVLGLAHFYSGDRRYAEKAAAVIRTWFLDPATAMNPNMNYAQAVPGRENGRGEGVLDTSRFQGVVETVGLIAPAGTLSAAETTALEQWFGRYVDWMQKSPNGRDEAAAKNNHGIWYDSQLAHYALFARRPDVARRVVNGFAKTRLRAQIDGSGRMPAELNRTRSLHYTIFALMPAYDVADLGRCLDVDLWSAPELAAATRFVAGYKGRIASWPGKEISPDESELDDLLLRVRPHWPDLPAPTAPGMLARLTAPAA